MLYYLRDLLSIDNKKLTVTTGVKTQRAQNKKIKGKKKRRIEKDFNLKKIGGRGRHESR